MENPTLNDYGGLEKFLEFVSTLMKALVANIYEYGRTEALYEKLLHETYGIDFLDKHGRDSEKFRNSYARSLARISESLLESDKFLVACFDVVFSPDVDTFNANFQKWVDTSQRFLKDARKDAEIRNLYSAKHSIN